MKPVPTIPLDPETIADVTNLLGGIQLEESERTEEIAEHARHCLFSDADQFSLQQIAHHNLRSICINLKKEN